MKCNIGDKIRFLNDVGGGIIVGIANKTTVIVRDSDGFDIPTYIANIVVVAENNEKNLITEDRIKPIEFDKTAEITKNKQPTEKSQIKTNSETNIAQPEDSDGIEFEIALGFLPVSADNPNDSDLEIFMINDSSYRMFYTFGKWKQSEIEPVNKGELEGDSKEFVGILKKDEVVESPVFQINLILFKNRNYTAQTVQQIDFEINPVKFLNKKIFTENDFFEQNAYIYILTSSRKKLKDYIDNLSDSDIEKSLKEKNDIQHKKPETTNNSEIEEVDLHIEALVENRQNLSNGEMLKLQIDRFTIALDLGIAAHTKRMVFIHGIGYGKLKLEIRRLLDTKYADKVRYQDASFKEYGYGATMVYIK